MIPNTFLASESSSEDDFETAKHFGGGHLMKQMKLAENFKIEKTKRKLVKEGAIDT
jgi:hypothetical protein